VVCGLGRGSGLLEGSPEGYKQPVIPVIEVARELGTVRQNLDTSRGDRDLEAGLFRPFKGEPLQCGTLGYGS
jgi:hypothetical protein